MEAVALTIVTAAVFGGIAGWFFRRHVLAASLLLSILILVAVLVFYRSQIDLRDATDSLRGLFWFVGLWMILIFAPCFVSAITISSVATFIRRIR